MNRLINLMECTLSERLCFVFVNLLSQPRINTFYDKIMIILNHDKIILNKPQDNTKNHGSYRNSNHYSNTDDNIWNNLWICNIWIWNICNIWKNFRWIPKPGVPSSKPLADSKVDSAFHPSEVDKWVPGIFGPLEVALALRQLNPIHKKGL